MKTLVPVAVAVVACSSWGQSVISIHGPSHSIGYELIMSSSTRLTIERSVDGVSEVRIVVSEGPDDDGVLRVAAWRASSSEKPRAAERSTRRSSARRWEVTTVDPVDPVAVPDDPEDPWGVEVAAPAAAPRAMGTAMRSADFARLEEAIEDESLPQQKWAVLQAALHGGARFTVAQVGQLVSFFDVPAQRVGLVELARTRIVDAKNRYRLFSYFDSDAEKQQLRSLLGDPQY